MRCSFNLAGSCVGAMLLPALALAADLAILPADVPLTGPNARQQLLVVKRDADRVVADATGKATFVTSNPAVASVDENGDVRAVGDGSAVVTATIDGKTAAANVLVTRTKQPQELSFRNHVIPILTRFGCNSGACHGALAGKGGLKLSLRGYDPDSDHFVLTRQSLARRIDRQRPQDSLMLKKPTRVLPHGGGKRFEDDSSEYRLLLDWITAGANGPKESDARLVRLEAFPPAATLKPKDTMRVVVRAWYSDGHTEDVTRWAKFSSSEDLVASVNDEGLATVAGYGESAINVAFGTRVAGLTITSPYPNRVDSQTFAKSPRNDFIDELVLKKLESLHLPPSGPCDDREFIRRAFLDAAGILPTPEEVRKFVADRDPGRRTKLVDSLLERPEFVDYWTYKWSDMLLVSSRRLQQPEMWAFYRFVRSSVAENKPWDRFARDIVTASGSNLQNGAANYFVLHKDISELSEATAVTFLGMSVTCCRCHNHPLEKWTQDQYWSLANLFSRVTLKNGDRGGEVIVQEQVSGDVRHPRRGMPMPPAPLDGKPMPLDDPHSRRAHLADWLTAPENPYFAKAIVNRLWRNFMGRGLVEAEDDLRETNPASNKELLNALVKEFVAHRFDVKHLIRLMMNSAAYQRSSVSLPENAADDRFYSRYLVRRLSAEVILDAYSAVTGVPTPFDQIYTGVEGGTTPTGSYPAGVRALQLPDTQVASNFLNAFGRPERLQTCSCERQQEATVGQALHLNNGQTLNDKLRSKQCRIEKWLKDQVSDAEAVRRVFELALARQPTPAEARRFETILKEAAAEKGGSRREALEDLFWAVLTGKEFLFNR
jgi:Protein of unknown function (DUF1553)/Protein of unknown function (DUF1549)